MERTKKLSRWKYTGGGFLFLKDRRKIKPGDVFMAAPEDVPMAFRDTIKLVGPIDPPKPEIVTHRTYSIEKRGGGWFDILDNNGKKINEKGLKKEAAEEMIRQLISAGDGKEGR